LLIYTYNVSTHTHAHVTSPLLVVGHGRESELSAGVWGTYRHRRIRTSATVTAARPSSQTNDYTFCFSIDGWRRSSKLKHTAYTVQWCRCGSVTTPCRILFFRVTLCGKANKASSRRVGEGATESGYSNRSW